MKPSLDVSGQLLGSSDQQAIEGRALEAPKELVGDALEVVCDLLLDAALVARLRPAALIVLAVDVIPDELYLLEVLGGAAQDAPDPAVDQQHAPAPARADLGEGLDERRVVDDHGRLDRTWELYDLEEAGRPAGEDREAVGALGREAPAAQVRAQPLEVLAQRDLVGVGELLGLDLALGLVEQRTNLGRARLGGGKRRGIEVDEHAEHLALRRLERGEPAEAILGYVVGLHAL